MEDKRTEDLKRVVKDYFTPDPKIVGKLPRKNKQTGHTVYLDFVGHADITRILLEIDPHWRWVPIAWENGRPAIHVENGMATMWGELTLLGQARLGVGSVEAHKADLDKELVGDFLRNAAQRFGICLSLWSKSEWEDQETEAPAAAPARRTAPKKEPAATAGPETKLTKTQLTQFVQACAKANLDHEQIADEAGVELMQATVGDLEKLRAVFKAKAGK